MIPQMSLDRRLEHAVRRRVGDHQRREIGGVVRGLAAQILHINVAALGAAHDDDIQPGHDGAGRVGAVGGGGDEADGAVRLFAGGVIGADGEQSGILALAAGVGLQRDGGEAGDFAQPGLKFGDHVADALGVSVGRERVQVGDAGPRDRHHFSGGVELHGAGAERDHGAVERQILVGELAQEAHHFGFRAVRVEHRLAHERAGAAGGQLGNAIGGQR